MLLKQFSPEEHATWRALYDGLAECRRSMAHPLFSAGLEKLGIANAKIPSLAEVNARLLTLTGWQGKVVEGLVDNAGFFEGLTRKEFPIGNFIRDKGDLNYTPAPDIFHDLYGHLPFFADEPYARFCEEFGRIAMKTGKNPLALELWGRLFWFGVEFPLIETEKGRRIFGGGILSSSGECVYCLSDNPEVVPFDCEAIANQPYKIDEFQKRLFVLSCPQQLYDCLSKYEWCVKERIV